jgi:hypothetical protein
MSRVLFVTNGHGEAAIAKRIAVELRARGDFATDHLALVGAGFGDADFCDVGPQAAMPSGGLVAMGNVRAFAGDLRAGFAALFVRQLGFLRSQTAGYAAVVAVGDAFALGMVLVARRPAIFVGTAKSVYVAKYGPFERTLLARARRIFVRDDATARALQAAGVPAEAPGNVIVDLLASPVGVDWNGAHERIAILPGSRSRAYADAARLAAIARAVIAQVPQSRAALSIAPGLDQVGFGPALAGAPPLIAWPGPLGGILREATVALGQAGTANEAAAACGIPVVALELDDARKSAWYRMRQARLLGEALAVVPGDPQRAVAAIVALLADRPRRARMAAAGRERMGGAGGAGAIASAIAETAA